MKNELITEKNKTENTLRCCSRCGSEKVWRIQRTESEKIAYFLSGGTYAIKKYSCHACRYTTLLHANDSFHEETEVEVKKQIPFVNCSKCKSDELVIDELTPVQQSTYSKSLFKTAFRKLKCLSCNDETIISREEYEASVGNEH